MIYPKGVFLPWPTWNLADFEATFSFGVNVCASGHPVTCTIMIRCFLTARQFLLCCAAYVQVIHDSSMDSRVRTKTWISKWSITDVSSCESQDDCDRDDFRSDDWSEIMVIFIDFWTTKMGLYIVHCGISWLVDMSKRDILGEPMDAVEGTIEQRGTQVHYSTVKAIVCHDVSAEWLGRLILRVRYPWPSNTHGYTIFSPSSEAQWSEGYIIDTWHQVSSTTCTYESPHIIF